MIVCPTCGSETRVIETRDTAGNYQRRRRACVEIACGHRMSTVEIIVDDTKIAAGDPVLIERKALERIMLLIAEPIIAKVGISRVLKVLEASRVEETSEDPEPGFAEGSTVQAGPVLESDSVLRWPRRGR